MKQKRMTIIAVVCGSLCAVCVAAFMLSVQGQADAARAEALARYGGEQVEVCVATRDLAPGERVDLSAVETKLWVADLLPEGAVRDSGEIVGKTTTSSILKGEVVSSKRFENERDSLDIPAGKEAVSVPAKAVQAVGGAVRPGMSIDVYSSGNTTTTAIARGVAVLATSVGDSGSLMSSDSGWITLAVDSEKVQEIVAAAETTSLYFVIPALPEEAPSAQAASGEEPGQDASTQGASSDAGSQEGASKGSQDEGSRSSASSAASSAAASTSASSASSNDEDGDE